MNEYNIYIEGMDYYSVTECDMYKEINEHGYIKLSGYLRRNFDYEIRELLEDRNTLTVKGKNQNNEEGTVFIGLVESYEVKHADEYDELEVKLCSQTKVMDLVGNYRVFQSEGQCFEGIIDYINSNYGAKTINNGANGSIGHMSVQYAETDWSYIKRIVSEKNSFLIPSYETKYCAYYIGLSEKGSKHITAIGYRKEKSLETYKLKKENGVDVSLEDEDLYYVDSRDIFEIGSNVTFSEIRQPLYIYKVTAKLVGAVLVSTYVLKSKKGFLTVPKKNYNIIGASITATVDSVVNDKLKVTMSYDGIQDSGKLFEFATVYSSNDNAGWYCMPEVKDTVRVYFPSEIEEEAFVFNAMQVHKSGKDPKVKFFRNPQGKEIVFGVDYLKITNNDGLSIKLEDDKGITIESKHDVNINANRDIAIESSNGKVEVNAKENIKMIQDKSSVEVSDEVRVEGKQIHMQESKQQ